MEKWNPFPIWPYTIPNEYDFHKFKFTRHKNSFTHIKTLLVNWFLKTIFLNSCLLYISIKFHLPFSPSYPNRQGPWFKQNLKLHYLRMILYSLQLSVQLVFKRRFRILCINSPAYYYPYLFLAEHRSDLIWKKWHFKTNFCNQKRRIWQHRWYIYGEKFVLLRGLRLMI